MRELVDLAADEVAQTDGRRRGGNRPPRPAAAGGKWVSSLAQSLFHAAVQVGEVGIIIGSKFI